MTEKPKLRAPAPVLVAKKTADRRKSAPETARLDDTLSDSFPASDSLHWSSAHAGEPVPRSGKAGARSRPGAPRVGPIRLEQLIEIAGRDARQAERVFDMNRKRWIFFGIIAASVLLNVSIIVST